MSTALESSEASVTADVALAIGTQRLRARVSVPVGPMPVGDLLPLARNLANAVVQSAVAQVEEQGKSISCKKGCGACCRQLVPISQVEARRLRELVDELPEPRRSAVRARFAQARARLEESGLLDRLVAREGWDPSEVTALGMEYFRVGIPCPFLEDESCSIHPERPITCREYLVTSPAEHCANPARDTVDTIRIPLKVWTAVARFDKPPPGERFIRWVPLILAPEWADAHPEDTPPRPGPELLKELFEHLTGEAVPAPPVGLG